MTKTERRVMLLWIGLVVCSAVATWLSSLLALAMFFIIPIPFVLLITATPTFLLYLTSVLLLYVPLRRVFGTTSGRRMAIAAGAAAAVLAVGIAVPSVVNRRIEAEVAEMVSGDGGEPPLLRRGSTVAILVDRGLGPPEQTCWDECQHLLFSGVARTVVHGPLETLQRPDAAPLPVTRHQIVPMARGCDNRRLRAAYATFRDEWYGPPPPPYLWERLDALAREGKCFRSDAGRDSRADVYLVGQYDFDPGRADRTRGPYDLTLRPIDLTWRRSVLVRKGERLVPVMRRTQLRFRRLAVPLAIKAPFHFATESPGGWAYSAEQTRGEEPTYGGMSPWMKNDVRVPGLGRNRPGRAWDEPVAEEEAKRAR